MLAIPRTFQHFTRYLQIPDAVTRRWWQALHQAQWSDAVALRQSFLLRDLVVFAGQAEGVASPINTVKVIENLVKERCLTRTQANELQRYLLASTQDGRWMTRTERDGVAPVATGVPA